jgi:glutamate racemase
MHYVRIGVFDSGVGGLSVANAIRKVIPDAEVILREDKENLPYGTKTMEELRTLVTPIFQELEQECDVIVVACNTVTTNLIKELREVVKVPLVGMEPMVKPAAEATKSGTIAVFATPRTLTSERYAWLKETYAQGINVLEPDCSQWAKMVEDKEVNRLRIKAVTDGVITDGADVIVLGCTHYHWIEQEIKEDAAGQAAVIQPEQPVIAQLLRVIETIKSEQ